MIPVEEIFCLIDDFCEIFDEKCKTKYLPRFHLHLGLIQLVIEPREKGPARTAFIELIIGVTCRVEFTIFPQYPHWVLYGFL